MWTPIWQRHQNLPLDNWDRVVAFGLRFLPPLPMLHIPWNSQRVTSLAKHYKKRTARGPDAWAREDVAHLSPQRAQDVANLYGALEQGMEWPIQLITGMITAVRKTPQATGPQHYRPIVVLSFLYRLWATGISKLALPHIAQLAPDSVFGYVPSRQASDIVTLLQAAIEMNLASSEVLLGFNSDLVRCFNTLPRPPLLRILQHMGIPSGTILAWKQALKQLSRHFKVGSHIGEGVGSSTGFPEGDPLSCLAMLGFNYCLAGYMQTFAPSVACPMYVDNIQLMTDSVANLCQGVNALATFMEAWDISLDGQKSFGWATTTASRQTLRALGFSVKLHFKDLGAQMCYSALQRTQVSQTRISSVSHHWPILYRSSAPAWHKLLTIRVATWPKALYGCTNRLLAPSTTHKLRSQAMNSLHWNRAGASPYVRWTLMQAPLQDPHFFQIWHVLSTLYRVFRQFPLACSMWQEFQNFAAPHGQGPFHSLEQVLAQLHWHLDGDLTLWLHDQSFPFLSVSLHDLQALATLAWQQTICIHLAHRQDFQGLPSIDVATSFGTQRYADRAMQELLNTLQDGTFFTNAAKSKFSPEHTGFCAVCHVEDTLTHRAVHCPNYDALRRSSSSVVANWQQEPTAFSHHGLVPLNPHRWQLWFALLRLPDMRQNFAFPPEPGRTYHVFVDGSCSFPADTQKSLAGWACVILEPHVVLAAGVLPGIKQSIDRAELCALHAVALWSLRVDCEVHAYTDSQYAKEGFDFLRLNAFVPKHWSNQDLWDQILETMIQLPSDRFRWHKVLSHQDPQLLSGPYEDWIAAGNAFADVSAKHAATLHSADVLEIHRAFVQHLERDRLRVQAQLRFLMAMACHDLGSWQTFVLQDPEEDTVQSLATGIWPNDASLAAQLTECESSGCFVREDVFEFGVVCSFANWLAGVDILAAHQQYVTYLELLALLYISKGPSLPIPIVLNGRKVFRDDQTVLAGTLHRYTVAGALKVFEQMFHSLFRSFGISFSERSLSRPSVGILKPMKALLVGVPDDLLLEVHGLLASWTADRPIRRAADLSRPIWQL